MQSNWSNIARNTTLRNKFRSLCISSQNCSLTIASSSFASRYRISYGTKLPVSTYPPFMNQNNAAQMTCESSQRIFCRKFCSAPQGGEIGAQNKNLKDATDSSASKDEKISAYELAQQFSPPARFKRSFPTGLFANMQLHMAANIPFFRRIAVSVQQYVVNGVLDPSFSFEEFLEGAKVAYIVIRQITSNVKEVSQLEVLEGMVIKDNISDLSAADRNKGREVHDVYAELVSITLRIHESGTKPSQTPPPQGMRAVNKALVESAEWVQLRVRFLAAEVPTLLQPGGGEGGVQRGATDVVSSTWTFEGRLWIAGPLDPMEDVPARYYKARSRNPDLVWRLVDIRD